MQSKADTDFFLSVSEQEFSDEPQHAIHDGILRAYRWQYIFSGVELERFQKTLTGMVTEQQMQRIGAALDTLK